MARRLVLHIGAMKSGTSFIQNVLSARRAEYAEGYGLLFPGRRWREQVSAVQDLIERGGPGQEPMAADGPWHTLAAEVNAWDGDAVVSMEFLGPRDPHKIGQVLASFPGTDVQVVMTGRDLVRSIPAMWQESVQNNAVSTWPEFLEAVRREDDVRGPGAWFWRHQALARMCATWQGEVGRDHFTLVTVPPAGADPALLWQRFAGLIGVRPEDAVLDVRSNPGLGAASAMVMREVNLELAAAGLGKQEYQKRVKHPIAKGGLAQRAKREPRLGLDAAWALERGEREVEALRALDLRVVGDLEELRPRPVPGVHTDDITEEQQLEAAVDALAAAVLKHRPRKRSRAGSDPRAAAGPSAAPSPGPAAAPASAAVPGGEEAVPVERAEPAPLLDRVRRRLRGAVSEVQGAVGGGAGAGGAPERRPGRAGRAGATGATGARTEAGDRVAVVTMVRDEAVALPRWVEYYGAQVGVESLVVVDDGSTDGGTDDLPCTVLRLPPLTKEPFEQARMGTISGLAAALLHSHDAVLFVDADEFVVPDPAHFEGLRDYVRRHGRDAAAVGVVGLNVVQAPGDTPLDPARPVLDQRRHVQYLPLMCKPALAFAPVDWRWASHGATAPYAVDPRLWMFHLKFADADALRATGERRRRMVQTDGRAAATSWSKSGDELVGALTRLGRRLAEAGEEPTELDPAQLDLGAAVQRVDGFWRATGPGQLPSLAKAPVHRVPERFTGRF